MAKSKYLARLLVFVAASGLLFFASCDTEPSTKHQDELEGFAVDVFATESDSAFEAMEDLDRGDRENWQKPQMVISRLGDLSDKVVADIGAGTGYFSMPLSRNAKKVIAIDIEQQFLDYINRQVSRTSDRNSLNIETRLTVASDPSLDSAEVDMVLIVNTYPFISNRVAYFKKVCRGLKPDGRLVIISFKKEPLPVGPPPEEKVSAERVTSELDSAGFKTIGVDVESLDYQFTLTAEKRD